MKNWIWFLLLKVLFLGGVFIFFLYQASQKSHPIAAFAEEKAPEKVSEKSQENSKTQEGIPEIPSSLTLENAQKIREELELIRADIENKIRKMASLQQAQKESEESVKKQLQDIEREKRFLQETLQKEKEVKKENLKEAVEFISKMDPRKAGPMLENMDRDLVIQLLKALPQKQVTKLLESLNPEKAKEFMEYYTKIKSGREYEILKEIGLCQKGETAP